MTELDTRTIFSLPYIYRVYGDFLQKRPLLLWNNTQPSRVTRMMLNEVGELNGGENTGFFSHPENREDYRQQEVSDIFILAFSIFLAMRVEEDELPVTRIMAQVAFFAKEYRVSLVDVEQSFTVPAPFNDNQDEVFHRLQKHINELASPLIESGNLKSEFTLKNLEQDVLFSHLEKIMALCVVLHASMGLHFSRAIYEKIIRNILKYDPRDLELPVDFEQMSPERQEEIFQQTMTKIRQKWTEDDNEQFYRQYQVT